MGIRTPLAQVKGLGAAHTGTAHWFAQRLTAVALVPLTFWFVSAIIGLRDKNYHDFVEWLGTPMAAIGMLLFVLTALYHAVLGLSEVVEDYVHKACMKTVLLTGLKFGGIVLALMTVLALLRIHFLDLLSTSI